MFERFTESARSVVVAAQDEARRLRHNYIGTEHLLLGLLRDPESAAARALASLNLTIDSVRGAVSNLVGAGDEATTGQIPFTPRAKKILELSLREALVLRDNSIRTEHILLALARENEGVAAQVLGEHDAHPRAVATAVAAVVGDLPDTYVEGHTTETPGTRETRDESAGRRVRLDVSRGSVPRPWRGALLLGWGLFGLAFGLGVGLGWLIWG